MSKLQLDEDVVAGILLETVAKAGGARSWMVIGLAGQGCGHPACTECLMLSPMACALPRAAALEALRTGRALQPPPPDECPTCGSVRYRAHAVALARKADNARAEVEAVAAAFTNQMANAFGE